MADNNNNINIPENEQEQESKEEEIDYAEKLASQIEKCIKEEFNAKHLTGSISKAIKVEKTEKGYDIVIDPVIYDLNLYLTKKVIVRKQSGSYASALDTKGSPWGNHKGFIDNCLKKAIDNFLKELQLKAKVSGFGGKE